MAAKGVKCPYCGRQVRWTNKNKLKPHIQSTKVMCHGSGMERVVIESQIKLNKEGS